MKPDLSQLRDIHLPAAVSWWPPAPGWWLLLAIILLALAGAWLLYRRYLRNQWRRSALAELSRLRNESQLLTSSLIVAELSVLLRRVAISRFPREESARLNGEPWLAFLDRKQAGEARFNSAAGHLLITAPYAPATAIAPELMAQLISLCEDWINKLPSGARP